MDPELEISEKSDFGKGSRKLSPLAWLAVALIAICAALIRIRLLDIPLERDEGEYAYAGQLMLHGIAPYKLAWNMKFPGTYAAYALIMALLGHTPRAIHEGLLAVNTAATILVFLLARRLFEARAAVAACGTYAFLSLGSNVLGMAGHATQFVVPFAVAGTLLLFEGIDSGSSTRLFVSGLMFGTAVLMKQQGVFLGIFGGVWLVWNLARARDPFAASLRRLLAFVSGAVLPLAATFLTLWRLGVFERFWFWTFRYAREYASELSLSDAVSIFGEEAPGVVTATAALWLLAGAGLILVWWKGDKMRIALPLSLFLVFSFAAVCPGFYFREHYFILMLPAVALLNGAAVARMPRRASLGLWVWGLAMAISLFVQRDFLFRMTPLQVLEDQYGESPFSDAMRAGDYIRSRTKPDAKIAVLGSEPEIYFYADRLPATGYIYMYPLMEPQPFALQMQKEMIRELERNKPEYIVFGRTPTSWLTDTDSPGELMDWWNVYGALHYAPEAFRNERSAQDQTQSDLVVMRRKADSPVR